MRNKKKFFIPVIFLFNGVGLISCIIWQGIFISSIIWRGMFGPILYLTVLLFLIIFYLEENVQYSATKMTLNRYNSYFISLILTLTCAAMIFDDIAVILGFTGFREIQREFMGINQLAYPLILAFFIILYGVFIATSRDISGKTRWLYRSEGSLIVFLDRLCEYPFDFKNQQRFVNWRIKTLKKLFDIREQIQKMGIVYRVEEGIIEISETVARWSKDQPEYGKIIKSHLSNVVERLREFNQFLIDDLRQIMADEKIPPRSWRLFLYNCDYKNIKIKKKVGKLMGKLMLQGREFYIVEVLIDDNPFH